jgi:DNA-binding transcriptional MerR regulator
MSQEYSVSELEQLTGVQRRTIYYYTAQKLLPPPTGAGLAAKYGEVHFLRLRLINQMQRAHIRLSGIREALDAMTLDEMRRLVSEVETSEKTWSIPALQNWMVGPLEGEPQTSSKTTEAQTTKQNYSFLPVPQPELKAPSGKAPEFLARLKRKGVVDNTSWQRFVVIDGLEVSVRSDIADKYGPVLLGLLEQFKKHLGRRS